MRARAKQLAGAVAIAAYLVTAAATFRYAALPERPLFDGVHGAAPPYRWVDPPPTERAMNLPPAPGEDVVKMRKGAVVDASVSTDDRQAGVILYAGMIEGPPGERVRITIEPLDAASLAPPPAGMEFQTNAYRIAATFVGSGLPVQTAAVDSCEPMGDRLVCPTILLTTRYGALGMYHLEDGAWVENSPKATESSGGVFGDSPSFGTFVAVAEEGRIRAASGAAQLSSKLGDLIAIGLAVLAIFGAGVFYRQRMSSKREEMRRKAAGVKYRPPEKGARARPPK